MRLGYPTSGDIGQGSRKWISVTRHLYYLCVGPPVLPRLFLVAVANWRGSGFRTPPRKLTTGKGQSY